MVKHARTSAHLAAALAAVLSVALGVAPLSAAVLSTAVLSTTVTAQAPPTPAATQDDAQVRTGTTLFRERCAECHGADGKGVAGHDLTRLWSAGATDGQVFQTIRNGVPNTIMPSSTAPDDQLRALVAYLRSVSDTSNAAELPGNAQNGERLFWASCGTCHKIKERGGRLGPDLSRVNQSRDQLVAAIRTPSASLATGFDPVTLVTRDGRRVRALRKSEDAFSIQVMDTQERLQGYLKGDLREVVREATSVMPAFGTDKLTGGDLDDLLRFLGTLRPATSRRP